MALLVDFEKIFIPDRDMRILDTVCSGAVLPLHSVDAEFLLSIGFIAPYALSETGNEYVSTEEGRRYIEFVRRREAAKRAEENERQRLELEREHRQFRHDWKIAVFSSFAGALLSRPLWSGIGLVAKFFRSL